MGLYSLLARLVPRLARDKQRRLETLQLAPRRLERRRVLDAAAAGLMLEVVPQSEPYVQTSDFLSVQESSEPSTQQSLPESILALSTLTTSLTLSATDIFENDFVEASIEFTDSQVLQHRLQIDWGDGSVPNLFILPASATGSVVVSHQYKDDNPTLTPADHYTITVRVLNSNFDLATTSSSVKVHNLDPVIESLNITSPINENSTTTLSGTYSDVGTLDTHTLDIDWNGDNIFDQTVSVSGGTFSVMHQFLDDVPTNTPSDTFNVNIRLRDDDTGVDTDSISLTVNNLNPVVLLNPLAMIDENGTTTLSGSITDVGTLDTFSLTLNWGDPLSPANTQTFALGNVALTLAADGINWNPATRTFSLTHQYLDDNPSVSPSDSYMVLATATDDDTGVGSDQRLVLVKNVNPTIQIASNKNIAEGAILNLAGGLLGSFADIGTLDTHTATVDWGDGTAAQSVVVSEANGSGNLGASHIFADNGVYTVKVTVFDDDGGTVFDTFQVTVANIDPTLTGVTSTLIINEGQIVTLDSLGVGLQDPGFDNPNNPLQVGGSQETFVGISLNWGDGTPTEMLNIGTRTNGGELVFTTAELVSANHAYADNGPYTVTVTVRDDDGLPVARQLQVEVKNVAPTLDLTDRVLQINEGEILNLFDLGIFTDPGFNNPANPNGASVESFVYDINWGDGTAIEFGRLPVTVVDGQQEIATTGTLAASHFYADNDADKLTNPPPDNTYIITVTLHDDDLDTHIQTIEVRVLNVNPTLDPIAATDVTSEGITTLTLSFADPGADSFDILVDWGDQLALPPADRFVVETVHVGPTPTSYILSHQYSGPPDPLHPAADITISVKIRDDDFGTFVVDTGESNLELVAISNPGLGAEKFRIDTTPQVPLLSFPETSDAGMLFDSGRSTTTVQQGSDVRSVSGETKAASERFLELRIIAADGSEGTGYRLRPEVLKNLPALFRTLPDNHYALYLVNLETNARRLVIEVYVRNGKVIDPGDDSEGTRDRPPTDEQSSTPLGEQPAVEDASDRSAEPSAAKQASHSGNSAKHPAAALADNVPWSQQSIGIAAGRSGKLSQWTALAVGLAASANAQNWAKQVDEALAQATAQQWRKLQLHIPKKRKNP